MNKMKEFEQLTIAELRKLTIEHRQMFDFINTTRGNKIKKAQDLVDEVGR